MQPKRRDLHAVFHISEIRVAGVIPSAKRQKTENQGPLQTFVRCYFWDWSSLWLIFSLYRYHVATSCSLPPFVCYQPACLSSKMLVSSNFKKSGRRRKAFAFATAILVVLALFRAHKINSTQAAPEDIIYNTHPHGYQYSSVQSKQLIVASIMQDDVSWLSDQQLSNWSKSIYVTDDLQGNLTVPKNKGREAMVYLT